MLHVYYPEDALVKLYPEGNGDHWRILHYFWLRCCRRKTGVTRKDFDGYKYILTPYSFIQEDCKSLVNRSLSKVKRYVNDLVNTPLTGNGDVKRFLYRRTVPQTGNSSYRDSWYHVPRWVESLFSNWNSPSVPRTPVPGYTVHLPSVPQTLSRKRFSERVLKEKGFIHDDRQNCWYGTDKEGHSIAIDDEDVTDEDSIQQQ